MAFTCKKFQLFAESEIQIIALKSFKCKFLAVFEFLVSQNRNSFDKNKLHETSYYIKPLQSDPNSA